jgi:hypothetical protein
MISIAQIIQEMFGNNTLIFKGFIMIAATLILTLIITRNTRKMMILGIAICTGLFLLGIQPAYWFMAACAIAYTLGIWSNEYDEKELEFNTI